MGKKFIYTILFSCMLAAVLSGCGKKVSTMYYDAGMAYLENGQYEEADENFRLSIANEAETKECYRALGIGYINEGKYVMAIDALLNALGKSKGTIKEIDYDINYYLGYAYRMNGDYEKGVNTFSAIIKLNPKAVDAYYQRAICYLLMGEMTLADEDFNVVTTSNPNDYDLCLRIYYAMRDAGAKTEANSFLRAILENSDKKMSDYDKGRILYYLEDYSDARVYLEKSKDVTNPETYLMLGKTYEAINDYAYAASLYNSYLNEKGNNAEVYNQLGICRVKAGDYEAAITAFSFGLKLEDPKWNKTLLFNEAVTYEYMLDFETANEKFKEYSIQYPKDDVAKREIVFLETR